MHASLASDASAVNPQDVEPLKALSLFEGSHRVGISTYYSPNIGASLETGIPIDAKNIRQLADLPKLGFITFVISMMCVQNLPKLLPFDLPKFSERERVCRALAE